MTHGLSELQAALADRYRIERELGAGGMAVVYLALDLRHDRKVALKVLRAELSAILGAGRFLKEIRTTANLQHPHILPLHDSGEADGVVFYVMPYVEGESLRDRLTREHQLPVDDAVRIAREVASALDYAHRHNVVHRDIKPENILLHDGQALVADFGIALAAARTDGSTRLTETGMSLGTPHYMAPEQAMGEREITPKADIYALGCVLYEMLSGEPPFNGPTAQAIIARVMTEQPRSLMMQRHTIPLHIEAAVQMALEKLPADRFSSAAQFAEALAKPGAIPTHATAAAAAVAASPREHRRLRVERALRLAPWTLAAIAVAVAAWALARARPQQPVTRYGLSLPASQATLDNQLFRISADGANLVYVGPGTNGTQLWVKQRSRYEATPLGGTDNALNFTFSPDGQWIAFVQGGRLKKLPLVGGAAITLADSLSVAPGIAWMDDGHIVFILTGQRELRRIPDVGGLPETIWRSDSVTAVHPTALPGGRSLLYIRCRGGRCGLEQDLWSLDLGSGADRRLLAGVAMARYVPTGHLVYVRRDGAMLGVPFDAGALEISGSSMPLLDSIALVNDVAPLMDVSASGTLVVRQGGGLSSRELYSMVWVDRSGRETPVDSSWTFRLTVFGGNAGWALSPDGTRLAIGLNTDAGDDIWVKHLPNGPLSRVTTDSASEYRPRWMAGGGSIMFASNRSPSANLYARAADGTGVDSLLLDLPDAIFEGAWSPDRQWLLARTGGTLGQVGGRNIIGVRAGDTTQVPLVVTSFDEAVITLSPDGRWLAHESNETGRTEIYLRPFPNTQSAKWQVSNGGGVAPLWDRRSRDLYYVNAAREMIAVAVTPGAAPRLGPARVLFRLREDLYLANPENYTPYDIGPGGRFIMGRRLRSQASQQASPLIITDNWFEELRQRTAGSPR